jgi:hypothetical protein
LNKNKNNSKKLDANEMINSLKVINSQISTEQKEFFIQEINKLKQTNDANSHKSIYDLFQNFQYFKEEVLKKLEEKDNLIKELLSNQNQQQTEDSSVKMFKEESVKTLNSNKQEEIKVREVR